MIGRTNGIWLGTDTTDATATADKIVYGKIGYADGERLVGEGAYLAKCYKLLQNVCTWRVT